MKSCLLLLLVAASFTAVHADEFAWDVPDRVWIDFGGDRKSVV